MSGPWFEFAPGSEQEVVALFGFLLPHLDRRFLINEVRQAFPDCEAWEILESGQRKKVRIEFELRASNFVAHKHDSYGCDLIVCWEDDLGQFEVERIELKKIVASLGLPVIQSPGVVKYPLRMWSEATFLSNSPPEIKVDQERLIRWAGQLGPQTRIAFAADNQFPSWSFAVNLLSGKRITLFGSWADGTLWVQPRGLPGELGERFCFHLAELVNDADLKKQWFLRHNAIRDERFLEILKAGVIEVLSLITAPGRTGAAV